MRKEDREFRLPAISHLDYKTITMDRVLTSLFPRLLFGGAVNRVQKRRDLTVETFVQEFLDPKGVNGEKPDWFVGFDKHPDIVRAWVLDNLLDVVNRGRPTEAVAAPRPLHLDTFKFRNPKYCRDYGASQQLYWMLYAARSHGQASLDELKRFFRIGIDPVTGRDQHAQLDVETQALLRLSSQIEHQIRDDADQERSAPLCLGSCDVLAEDVRRLLAYQRVIPRSVLVEYLKTLFAFHLALYHLRLAKLLPALVAANGESAGCQASTCPGQGVVNCQGRTGILIDAANQAGSPIAALAETSAEFQYRRAGQGLVRSQILVGKLATFADQMERMNKLPRPEHGMRSVHEILRVLGPSFAADRDNFFAQKLFGLLNHLRQDGEESLSDLVAKIEALDLSPLEKYLEINLAQRSGYWRDFIVSCLDSLLLKNKDGAMVAQPRTKNARRRFIFDGRMIEVLVQIAVLEPTAQGFRTKNMHVDDLLTLLRNRYGIHIDQLPLGEGFQEVTIGDRTALRSNLTAFRSRLRDIGFLRDLSDAYTSQTITPRYEIMESTHV